MALACEWLSDKGATQLLVAFKLLLDATPPPDDFKVEAQPPNEVNLKVLGELVEGSSDPGRDENIYRDAMGDPDPTSGQPAAKAPLNLRDALATANTLRTPSKIEQADCKSRFFDSTQNLIDKLYSNGKTAFLPLNDTFGQNRKYSGLYQLLVDYVTFAARQNSNYAVALEQFRTTFDANPNDAKLPKLLKAYQDLAPKQELDYVHALEQFRSVFAANPECLAQQVAAKVTGTKK